MSVQTASSQKTATWKTVATFSRGMARTRYLKSLVEAERVLLRPGDAQAAAVDVVIGWGDKKNTKAAIAYARRHGIPYWRVEDGFLRSVGLGVRGHPPLSIVLDDCGIYYDARHPSRLENLLNASGAVGDAALVARARTAMSRIVESRLSKYNDSCAAPVSLGSPRKRVLVVDQTRGDLSVGCGLANASSFARMLDAALREHPDAEVVVKTHPDVIAKKKRGYLELVAHEPRVRVLAEPVNPIALLEQVDHVYVVTSQLGFEALLVGKNVTCFGVPFYAGWGLTQDRSDVPRRTQARSLEEVFAAAYILYPRYVAPVTGEPCEMEDVIAHLSLQRSLFAKNQGQIFCFGFQFWKHNVTRAYLRSPGNRIVFVRSARGARRLGFDSSAKLLVWGERGLDHAHKLSTQYGVDIWRMEDGFLRSVGLGSDLAAPASLVLDRQGIYYDPRKPSELELILQTAKFSDDEIKRAQNLRQKIIGAGLSKYNLGGAFRASLPEGDRVLLVPGQVEDDASVQLGCRDIRTNKSLLQEVRRHNPQAFVVYKPHPDVLSGNRRGRVDPQILAVCADHVETDASLAQCLAVAHEVHTMTSLVGFEALLRNLDVSVYGQPFYAGWGLTVDRHPNSRRTRRLTLDQLVAGVLIRYPRYLDRRSGRFATPESIVTELCAARDAGGINSVRMWWPLRQLQKLVHAYRGITYAP